MSNLNVFISSDYGWIPKKKSKARKKLFGEDDFKFFIFMSIFIFCLAGLVLIIVGLNSQHALKYFDSKISPRLRFAPETRTQQLPALRRAGLSIDFYLHYCPRNGGGD